MEFIVAIQIILAGMAVLFLLLGYLYNTDTLEKISRFLSKPFIKNDLYQCDLCERYFREYQLILYKKATGKDYNCCPHCEKNIDGVYVDLMNISKVKKEQEWMKHHPHCARINIVQYIKTMRNAKKLKALKTAEKDQKAFEKYEEKFKGDMSWIDNLQRRV